MSAEYDEAYYRGSCGGSDFFARFGASVVKPALALALKRADLREGMTALDIGCGRGELLHQLKKRGVRAVGADFSPAALGLARTTSRAPVLRADARKLPFHDGSFDRVFFLGVVDHLADADLESCLAEFRRLLKPGGVLLLNTCVNTDYHKRKTYALRLRLARALGLRPPRRLRSAEDEELHVNEHNESGLRAFLERQGWEARVEPRPNDKFVVDELYEKPLPAGFPLKTAKPWKRAVHGLFFRGPWKKYLARELFCVAHPKKR